MHHKIEPNTKIIYNEIKLFPYQDEFPKLYKSVFLAPGSVIKQGFIVPKGKLTAVVPAKIIRDLSDDEIEELNISAMRYKEYTKITIESLRKFIYQV